jgi:hypothetical protein
MRETTRGLGRLREEIEDGFTKYRSLVPIIPQNKHSVRQRDVVVKQLPTPNINALSDLTHAEVEAWVSKDQHSQDSQKTKF